MGDLNIALEVLNNVTVLETEYTAKVEEDQKPETDKQDLLHQWVNYGFPAN